MSLLASAGLPDLPSFLNDAAISRLFTQHFVQATGLFDELVDAAAWAVLGGLSALPGDHAVDPDSEWALKKAVPSARTTLNYLFRKLHHGGYFERGPGGYRATGRTPGSVETAAEVLGSFEPGAAAATGIVRLLVDEAPAFFRGDKSGEDILFSAATLPLWFRYFSNANPLYSINNTLGAEILSRVLPPENARVLEVGGGAGSAAELALEKCGSRISTYCFTELVPAFFRRGERLARASASPGTAVESKKLDMTKSWQDQGIEPESFDAVYSVNCFHVARDLDQVLSEALRSLRPGGSLVLSECVKPGDGNRAIYVDFIFEFLTSFSSVKLHPTRRPRHGFLSPSAWKASLAFAGFSDPVVCPDVDTLASRFPDFFVAAITGQRPI